MPYGALQFYHRGKISLETVFAKFARWGPEMYVTEEPFVVLFEDKEYVPIMTDPDFDEEPFFTGMKFVRTPIRPYLQKCLQENIDGVVFNLTDDYTRLILNREQVESLVRHYEAEEAGLTGRDQPLQVLEQTLSDVRQSGDAKAVLQALSETEELWGIVDRKGYMLNLSEFPEGMYVADFFTSEAKANACIAELEKLGRKWKGLKAKRSDGVKTLLAMITMKPLTVLNRYAPEEWRASYDVVYEGIKNEYGKR